MSHADKVRDAERAVVEAATRFVEHAPDVNTLDVTNAVDDLLALRAATCETCGGTGQVVKPDAPGIRTRWYEPCPAGCKEGRKP